MSLRVLCALEELNELKGLQYRLKIYPRKRGDPGTKEVHPLGKSPVFCIGPKPEEALTEARLVLQYLSDTYSQGIWEPDAEDKARDVFLQEFANASLLTKVDFTLIMDMPGIVYPFGIRHLAGLLTMPFRNHFRNDLQLYFQYMEDALSEEKPWFTGRRHGLADFNMIFGMDMAAQRGYFDGSKYPKVQSWLDRIHELPAYQRALKKGGVYNLVTFGT
ncbi:hypothetical protein LTS08_002887 [Lithohypha guttulata]|nr:hypothetical protein LTS08_002887 [Lithohypha guttulata]